MLLTSKVFNILVVDIVILHKIIEATIAGQTYMDPLVVRTKPPTDDPCNTLYWYPRLRPDYCYKSTTPSISIIEPTVENTTSEPICCSTTVPPPTTTTTPSPPPPALFPPVFGMPFPINLPIPIPPPQPAVFPVYSPFAQPMPLPMPLPVPARVPTPLQLTLLGPVSVQIHDPPSVMKPPEEVVPPLVWPSFPPMPQVPQIPLYYDPPPFYGNYFVPPIPLPMPPPMPPPIAQLGLNILPFSDIYSDLFRTSKDLFTGRQLKRRKN